MKKLLLLSAFSFCFATCSLSQKLPDPIVKDTSISLTDTANNEQANEYFIQPEMPAKNPQDIINDVDFVVQSVGVICPAVKPYTSIIGFSLTAISSIIIFFRQRRKHRKEVKKLTGK